MAVAGRNVAQVELVLSDKLSGQMRAALSNIQGFGRGAQRAFQGVGRAISILTAPIRGLIRHLLSVRGLIATVASGFGVVKFIELAADVERVDAAFANLIESIGGDAPSALARFRQATRGTVDDMRLMQAANRAVFLGVGQNVDQIGELMDIARRLGKAMGRDALQAFEDLSLGIGRQSRLILDNLGIIVKVEDANKAYAASLGKTVAELTDAEKRQGFMNAVLESARRKLASLGEETLGVTELWRQFKTIIFNTMQTLARAFGPAIALGFERINKFLEDGQVKFYDFAIGVVRSVRLALPSIGEVFGKVQAALGEVIDQAQAAWDIIARILGIKGPNISELLHETLWKKYYNVGRSFQMDLELVGANQRPGESLRQYIERLFEEDILDPMDVGAQQLIEKFQRTFGQTIGGEPVPSIMTPAVTAGEKALEAAEEHLRLVRDQAEEAAALKRELEGIQILGPPIPAGWGGRAAAEIDQATEAMEELEYTTRYTRMTAEEFLRGLQDLSRRWTDFYGHVFEGIQQIGASISHNLTDAILDWAKGVKSASEAFSQAAQQILEDISRIVLNKAFEALFGTILGGIVPGAARGAVVSLAGGGYMDVRRLAGGGYAGIADRPTYLVGDASPRHEEAVVPLPDGRSIPVRWEGSAGQPTIVNNYYTQVDATDVDSFMRLFDQGLGRRQGQIGNIAAQQYQSRPMVRRRYG